VTREPELPAVRRWTRHRSVAQVAAEEIAVCELIRETPGEMMRTSSGRMLKMPPPANSALRDTGQRSDFAIAQSFADLLLPMVEFCFRPGHVGTYVPTRSGRMNPPDRYHRGPQGE